MDDDLLDHYREYGKPPTHHVYAQREDGVVTDETFAQMESLSDFEAGSFYVKPKKPPKLSGWKSRKNPRQ